MNISLLKEKLAANVGSDISFTTEESAVLLSALNDPLQFLTEEKEGYFIYASTGCSCCSEYNFLTGPFEVDAALSQIEYYLKTKRLASQYAKNGEYALIKAKYKKIGDQLIFDDKLHDKVSIRVNITCIS